MTNSKQRTDYTCLLLALFLFVLLYPYFLWGMFSSKIVSLTIKVGITLFVLLRYSKRLSSKEVKLVALYEFIWLLYVFLNLTRHGSNFNGVVSQIPICLYVSVCVMDTTAMKKIGNYLISIVSLVMGIGMVFYILSLVGLSIPSFGVIEHYSQADRTYTVYPFYVMENTNVFASAFRFCGPFDEPGVVGTLSIFFLYILRFDFKDWRTWICLIAGVLSFSFFFYVMVIIYWVTNFAFFQKSVWSILLVLALFGGLYYYTKDNVIIKAIIWQRFEWVDQEGKFMGDNRMVESGEFVYEQIRGTADYWWGLSEDKSRWFWDFAEGSSSYKTVIATNGMVFFVLYLFFFILMGWYYKGSKVDYLVFISLIIVCFYQRTNIYSVPYMFLYAYLARLKEIQRIESRSSESFSLNPT